MSLGGSICDCYESAWLVSPIEVRLIPGDSPIEGLAFFAECAFEIGGGFATPEIDLSLRVPTSQQAQQGHACHKVPQLAAAQDCDVGSWAQIAAIEALHAIHGIHGQMLAHVLRQQLSSASRL